MVLHSLSLLHHLCHWSILMSFCQYLNVRLTQSCTQVHAAAAEAFLKSIEVQLCSCFQTINFQFSRISPISVKKWPKDRLCWVGIGLGRVAGAGVGVQQSWSQPPGNECISRSYFHTNTVTAEIICRGVTRTTPNEWERPWKEVGAFEICTKYFHLQYQNITLKSMRSESASEMGGEKWTESPRKMVQKCEACKYTANKWGH